MAIYNFGKGDNLGRKTYAFVARTFACSPSSRREERDDCARVTPRECTFPRYFLKHKPVELVLYLEEKHCTKVTNSDRRRTGEGAAQKKKITPPWRKLRRYSRKFFCTTR